MGTNMIQYCKKCLYPKISVNLLFDDEGVCNACLTQEQFDEIPPDFWKSKEAQFVNLAEEAKQKSSSNYDCVIPVSGGKDSYFQVHKALEHGLKPLLVTYHGNNYLSEGQGNLDRMREKFDVDHIVFGPSVPVLKKLNKVCFELMGDMNWHAHAGIKIYPMHIAVRLKIPLVIWGEITWSIAGMFDPDDYVEYNKRTVFEHDLRGYTIRDMLEKLPELGEKDLIWLQMPSDQETDEAGTIGIYIGNFFRWDPNEHTRLMVERYDFELAREPFERTYRTISNLDDMHENGVHDYLKFIKFGYGRATDHASKDIRSGYMSREKGVQIVRKMDHVKPRDLARWLEYAGMTEEEFDRTADTFRDPRVWWIHEGTWYKDNLWGGASGYGDVKLPEDSWGKYRKK
jgi:N-acetyl sugar amidotransferase